jgi:hypothetical protein
MRWWRRRRSRAQETMPVRRQATWAQAAFPPEIDEAVAVALAAPAPLLPEQRAEPAVRLGFDDGTELHLPAEDPRARALQAVADLLVKTGPTTPTTSSETPRRTARRIV